MAKPKRMKTLIGTLKDKISLLKATLLLTSTRTPSIHVAVLRATSHNPCHSPPVHTLDNLIAVSHNNTPLLHALLQRVHHTSNVYVALKCLLTFHHVVSRGSQEQFEGPLFSDLSSFRDQSDDDTWELSNWVRWYADVLDQRVSLPFKNSLNLLIEILEKVSGCPKSLHYQKISLVYEIMKIIGEEYRVIVREIYSKVDEFSSRIEDFSDDSLEKFLSDLRRIEECKEKLFLMFLNKKKNDGFWELIEKVTKDVLGEKEMRQSKRIVNFRGTDDESNRWEMSRVDDSKSIVVAMATRGRRWLDVEWNRPLIVSSTA